LQNVNNTSNTLINPTVVQEVSKNVKYIPNVNPFMSQLTWNFFSIVNKKRKKKWSLYCMVWTALWLCWNLQFK